MACCFGEFCAAGLPQGHKVDRLQHNGGEPTITRDIADDVARVGENQTRDFNQQNGFNQFRRRVGQGDNGCINQFGQEHRAPGGAVFRFRGFLGFGLMLRMTS